MKVSEKAVGGETPKRRRRVHDRYFMIHVILNPKRDCRITQCIIDQSDDLVYNV